MREGKSAIEIVSLKEQLEVQRQEAAQAYERVKQLQDEAEKEAQSLKVMLEAKTSPRQTTGQRASHRAPRQ